MKKSNLYIIATIAILFLFQTKALSQQTYDKAIDDKRELKRLKLNVEKDPDNLADHKAFIDAMGILNKDLPKQYEAWVSKFPKSSVVPFVIGDTLSKVEEPSAKPFLLTAIERNPRLAAAYNRLAFDADRWGDAKGFSDNMKIASDLEPTNPHYAYYYASSLHQFDLAKWKEEMMKVAYHFKDHQRGRMAMFILADKVIDQYEKIYYLQLLHDDFDNSSSWYRVGMETYFDIMLKVNPSKALSLADEMMAIPKYRESWSVYREFAVQLIKGKKQLDSDPTAALATFEQIKPLRADFKFNKQLPILRSQALSKTGSNDIAYGFLISYFTKSPTRELIAAIQDRGALLGKDSTSCKKDISDSLLNKASVATDFQLKQYLSKGNLSLNSLKGKPVLLTYWFPGCGPCRAEFPHFENVLNGFEKNQIAYLAINIDKRQNEYVIPFMEKTKYTFIPLEEQDGRQKGSLDNGRSAPVNFVINKDGKILFSKFRIDATNEDELKIMLQFALGG